MNDYDDNRLATPAEADSEYATNVGRDRRDVAWILSDRDVWYRNPSYQGPPVPHPDEDHWYGQEDEDESINIHVEGDQP